MESIKLLFFVKSRLFSFYYQIQQKLQTFIGIEIIDTTTRTPREGEDDSKICVVIT